MRKKILGGLAAAAMFATGFAVNTSTALADEGTETVEAVAPVETTPVETTPVEVEAEETDVEIVESSAPDPAASRTVQAADRAVQETNPGTTVTTVAPTITDPSTEFSTPQTGWSNLSVWDATVGKYVEGETVAITNVAERPLDSEEPPSQPEKRFTTHPSTARPPRASNVPTAEGAVARFSPVPASTSSESAVRPTVPAVGELPATGSHNTRIMVLIALLATTFGGFTLLVADRRNVTS